MLTRWKARSRDVKPAEVGRVHVGAALEQEAHGVQMTAEDPVKQRVPPGDQIGIMDPRAALGVQLPESNKVALLGRASTPASR